VEDILNNRRPGIEKACDYILRAIDSQRFDRELPSIRALADAANVSFVTMWKAVAHLRKKGAVISAEKGRAISPVYKNSKPRIAQTLPAGGPVKDVAPNNSFWVRIKAQIKKDILNGRYSYGALLPSCKELQHFYNASYPTMKKTLNALVSEGAVITHRNGFMVPALTTNPNSRVVAIGCGWEDGKIWVDYQDKNYFRILESECIRLNIALDVVVYFRQNGRLCFIHSATRLPYRLTNDDILGIAYVVANLEINPEEVLRKLLPLKKPISVLDVVGGWKIPAFSNERRTVQFFTVTASIQPARQVARYLLSRGHRSIAFISPFHKALWSNKRLEGVLEIFSEAGYPKGVKSLVLDNYAYQWDYLHNPETSEDLRSLISQYNEWKKNTRIKFFKKFGNISYSIAKYLTEWNCASGEIYQKMVPLFNKALKDTTVTAWLMANDYSATLALDYLKEKQIAVPERVAMIAFDNTLDAMEYQLTSYDFNNTGIVNIMLRYIISPSASPATGRNEIIEVEGSIVERRSTLRI
jgi:DNA-binding transcriptional regulator YhcF (GntR family)